MQTRLSLLFSGWELRTGQDINPVAADLFVADQLPDGTLRVTNYSSKPYGGALMASMAWNTAIPMLPFFGLDLDFYLSSFDAARLGRLEMDLKVALADGTKAPIPNIVDGSTQWNVSTGEWQIDRPGGGWSGTGYRAAPPVDRWAHYSMRGRVDGPTYSILSLAVDRGPAFAIPSAMQHCPLLTESWVPVAAAQLQTEVLDPGVVSVAFRNVTATFSNALF